MNVSVDLSCQKGLPEGHRYLCMVDFQSRDTRRGPTSDEDDDDDEDDDASETPQTEADEAMDSDTATEPTSETDPGAPTDTTSTDSARVAETSPSESLTEQTADPRDHQPAHSAANEPSTETEPAESMPTQPLDIAVVTVGTTADADVEDALTTAFESAGHTIVTWERLAAEYDTLQHTVDVLIDRDDVDVVVTTGGIGLGTDEVTIEAVHPLFEKALPGFGEAFRTILFEHIGTGIVAVRSTAGIANGTLVFCLPGGHEAAALAVEEIIATEAPELVPHLD